MRTRTVTAFLLLGLLSVTGWAADARGCKDHPLFTRMSGYQLAACEKKFEQLVIKLDEDPDAARNPHPEGDRSKSRYEWDDAAGTPPDFLQVLRNYQNAATARGGAVLAEHPRYTALKFTPEGRTVYASVEVFNEGRTVELQVLEQQAMAQEVSANLMWDALRKDGFVTLPVLFDTGKASIRPESAGVVRQIAYLLKQQPALKVSIEGHTDNQGNAAANKALSQQRAKAVVDAVTAQGVAPARMSAVGWGQDKPVADNRSHAGRARNRRVEMLKQ